MSYFEECLEAYRAIDQGPFGHFIESNLAMASLLAGDTDHAEARLVKVLPRCHEVMDPAIREEALVGLAGVAVEQGDSSRAAWLAGAADAVLAEGDLSSSEVTTRIRDRYLPRAHRALGDEAYQRSFEQGRRASFDDAIAFGLRNPPSSLPV